jgi:hypothetical protein
VAEAFAAFNLSALEGRPPFFFSLGTVGSKTAAEGGENAGIFDGTAGGRNEGFTIVEGPGRVGNSNGGKDTGGRKDIPYYREMSFPSKKFDPELPTNGSTSWVLVGASRSGKSTLMKYLYSKYFKKCITMMFSMNHHADIYKDFGSKILCADEYHPELIREAHEINRLTDNAYDFCFIFDDYVDIKAKNDPEITRLLTLYRNSAQNSVFSSQGRTLISAVGRNSANYVCIFKQQTNLEWENVIKEYLAMHLPPKMTMREMIEFCMAATRDHQFFMLDNVLGECYISKLSSAQIRD